MAPSSRRLARILIVDDNANDVFLVQQAVEAANPQSTVTHIADGEEAFQLFEGSSEIGYDLVVLDWRLPRRSAEEIVAPLLASNRSERTRIVVLSSAIPPQVQSALARKGVTVLIKPLDLSGYAEIAQQLNSLLPH